MTSLLAFIARTLVLAIFTFGFVVLFEHGPSDFVKGAPIEWKSFAGFVKLNTGVSLPTGEESTAAPQPAAPQSQP
jgi:hypothetical protein